MNKDSDACVCLLLMLLSYYVYLVSPIGLIVGLLPFYWFKMHSVPPRHLPACSLDRFEYCHAYYLFAKIFSARSVHVGFSMAVYPWSPNSPILEVRLAHFSVWMQIFNLPLECYTEEVANPIASQFGTLIAVDISSQYRLGGFRVKVVN
ncbi:hypothetical protein K1719_023830 [Acacia pycnantha]|nr:hypothetical protein K1719_023830 [Acacia pycnantha]